MNIINVLEYSLSIDNTLNFIVNIPRGTYIKEFYIADSKDILDNKGVKVIDVYNEAKKHLPSNYSAFSVFNTLFTRILRTTDYDTYTLNANF
jgi:hypothetical protein